mmetsp:Transcript_135/g.369  ORF Transcript_135/g.369 Transcript_135/m.369 type:complete len:367 (+) Transcript_135:64-1164(+)
MDPTAYYGGDPSYYQPGAMDATAYYGGDPAYYQQQARAAAAPAMTKDEKMALVKKLLKRDKKRDAEEGKTKEIGSVIYTVMGLGLLNAVSWICPLFLYGWHDKAFVTAGAKMFRLSTSLHKVNISVLCGKNSLEDRLCNLLHKAHGEYDLRALMDYACLTRTGAALKISFTMGPMLCDMMKREFYVALVPLIAFPLVSILYLLAVFFLYFYYETSHKRIHRSTGMMLLTIAPVIGLTAWLIFTFVAPDLSELPLAVTGGASSPLALLFTAGGQDSSGLGTEVAQVDYGRGWFMTIMCLVWSALTILFTYNWLSPREDEEEDEDDNAKEEAAAPPPPAVAQSAWTQQETWQPQQEGLSMAQVQQQIL